MNTESVLKRIRKEPDRGQVNVYGLRDLPGQPLAGPPYLAARCYDEYTADVLVKALKAEAKELLEPGWSMKDVDSTPPKVERLPKVDLEPRPRKRTKR